jgi:hypothetical protein
MAAARSELEALGVVWREMELRKGYLYVAYENRGEERDTFVLACLLMLARPLAQGTEAIQVVGFHKEKRLFDLTVPPASIDDVYSADLSAEELARARGIAQRCLAKAGAGVQGPSLGEAGPPGVAAGEVGQARAPEGAPKAVEAPERTRAAATPPARPGPEATPPAAVSGQAAGPAPSHDLTPGQERELAQALLTALTKTAVENVQIGVDAQRRWFVSFENRTYRTDLAAVGAAFEALGKLLPVGQLVVQVKRDAVPVCSVTVDLSDYARLEAGLLPPVELARRWDVEPGAQGVKGPVRILAEGNASYRRVDVSLRPKFHYEIGREFDPFQSDLFLLSKAETTLAPGWRASALASSQLTSGHGTRMDTAVLTHTRWVSERLLATGSVGLLREGIYGWYGEMQWDLGTDRLGVVGSALGDHLGGAEATQAFGYYEREFGALALTTRIGYGRFLESGQSGGAVSLVRRFGESSVGGQAVRNSEGDEGLNFWVQVPFGPHRASDPAALRLRTAPFLEEDYHSNAIAQGDYLQGDYDLRRFRGELTAPYVRAHGERIVGGASPREQPSWPVAPSFEGTSGLLRIPTADVAPDGQVSLGVAWIDRNHSKATARTSVMPLYGSLGLLPNLEIVTRLSILHDVESDFRDWPYAMDRSFSLHYRVLRQTKSMPAVAIGAQDVQFGTRSSYIGRAEYVVGTWQQGDWRLHMGAGKDRLGSVFGGLDWNLWRHRAHLMAEYDGDYVNVGARLFLGSWGSVDVGALGLSGLSGAVVFHTLLR